MVLASAVLFLVCPLTQRPLKQLLMEAELGSMVTSVYGGFQEFRPSTVAACAVRTWKFGVWCFGYCLRSAGNRILRELPWCSGAQCLASECCLRKTVLDLSGDPLVTAAMFGSTVDTYSTSIPGFSTTFAHFLRGCGLES